MRQFLIVAGCALALEGATFPPKQFVSVDLVASTMRPRPGSRILIGFRMIPQPGWHGYWSNPGGSGVAPVVHWTAPNGMHFGPLLHPAPTLLRSMGLVSFVHAGPHVLISRVELGRSIARGTRLPVSAELTWAACSDKLCVPEHAELSLQMVAGNGEPSKDAALLNAAVAKIPARAADSTYEAGNDKLVLQLPARLKVSPGDVHFFPDRNGYYDVLRARVASGRPVRIISPVQGPAPDPITGVVSDGSRSYRIAFRRHVAVTRAVETAAPRPRRPSRNGRD